MFEFLCSKCSKKETVSEMPSCPGCGYHARLCERHMDTHDCKQARKDAKKLAQDAQRGLLD